MSLTKKVSTALTTPVKTKLWIALAVAALFAVAVYVSHTLLFPCECPPCPEVVDVTPEEVEKAQKEADAAVDAAANGDMSIEEAQMKEEQAVQTATVAAANPENYDDHPYSLA